MDRRATAGPTVRSEAMSTHDRRRQTFDPVAFKTTTREQWQDAAEAWHRWGDFIGDWLGEATEAMLDLARHRRRAAGCSTWPPAPASSRCGPPAGSGRPARCSRPTSRPTCSSGPPPTPRAAGLDQVGTLELDGEALDTLDAGSFDAVVSRVGLIYFPDQQRALRGMRARAARRRPGRARSSTRRPSATRSSRCRSGSSARRAAAAAAAARPARVRSPSAAPASWPDALAGGRLRRRRGARRAVAGAAAVGARSACASSGSRSARCTR